MLVRWNIAAMKSMLYADAVVGPFLRYVDPFTSLRRFLARRLPNQPLMCWAHLVRSAALDNLITVAIDRF
jgi:hypothetical protein